MIMKADMKSRLCFYSNNEIKIIKSFNGALKDGKLYRRERYIDEDGRKTWTSHQKLASDTGIISKHFRF